MLCRGWVIKADNVLYYFSSIVMSNASAAAGGLWCGITATTIWVAQWQPAASHYINDLFELPVFQN
jgi:hypothetical protein